MASIAAIEKIAMAPDVLRRFLRTEHVATFGAHSIASNDGAIVREVTEELERQNSHLQLRWRVIKDNDLPQDCGEMVAIVLEKTQYMMFGMAALFAIDNRTREVFGFVSSKLESQVRRRILSVVVQSAATVTDGRE